MRRQIRLIAVVAALLVAGAAGAAGFTSSGSTGYVVQPGDSLWAIASDHGTTVAALAAANRLDPGAILPIGKVLYLPGSGAAATESSYSSSSASSGSASSAGGSASNERTFCATFSAPYGPYGVLPSRLTASPARLALRPLFEQWAAHYGVSLPLLEAVAWQESGWQQGVVSSTGAIGVGQIMPGTATFISGTLIGEPMNINSVSDNIRMSAAFLAYLAHVEGNNRCSTIAAYYEGPLNLSAYGVFRSSQAYVASVEALLPRFE